MRAIRRISAVILGFVFFFAGILKVMDPVGAGLVVEEYFKFFHLNFMLSTSAFFGSAGALFESLLGVALITGVWRKIIGLITSLITAVFTILTVILYIANPNMDCGCFGEAIHFTHLQSLIKNIILLALCAIAFIPLKRQEQTRKIKYVSFSIASLSVAMFFLFSVFSIPIIDFTTYKPGEELMLPDDIDIPEGAAMLSFSDSNGEYADSLAIDGKVIIISVYDVEKITQQQWEKVSAIVNTAIPLNCMPLILTASYPDEIASLVNSPELLSHIYFADRRTLLTFNRSNGGVSFISDGQIVTKWGKHKYPDKESLSTLCSNSPTESLVTENNGTHLKFQGFLLYVFAVMLLL